MGVLDGRTAIVTGGARGIGGAIARRFAAEGAAVVVNDLGGATDGGGRDASAATSAVQEILAAGGRAVADGGDPRRAPDNVAALALYLASERSDWLTGRVLENWGFDVGLYANPTVVATASSEVPWGFDDLAARMEGSFRPLADGLPESLFADQARRP